MANKDTVPNKRTTQSMSPASQGVARLQTPEEWRNVIRRFVSDNDLIIKGRAENLIAAEYGAEEALQQDIKTVAYRFYVLSRRAKDELQLEADDQPLTGEKVTKTDFLDWILTGATLRCLRALKEIVRAYAQGKVDAQATYDHLVQAQRQCAGTFFPLLVEQARQAATTEQEQMEALKSLSAFTRSRLSQTMTIRKKQPDGSRSFGDTESRLKRYVSAHPEYGPGSSNFERALAERLPSAVLAAMSVGKGTMAAYDQLQNGVAWEIEQEFKPTIELGREKKAATDEYGGDTTRLVEEKAQDPSFSPNEKVLSKLMAKDELRSKSKQAGLTDKDEKRLSLEAEGYSAKQAADKLNEPLETYKKGLSRARQKLRKKK